MNHEPTERRSFLAFATAGLGALFTVFLGAPIAAYVTDPRHRKGAAGDFRMVEGLLLSELEPNRPTQGVLSDVRHDAWTLHPNDVVGRVWVILKKPRPADFPTGTDESLLGVFTTICPHLGCSVNLNQDQQANPGFTCPCHSAQFDVSGTRKAPDHNPAARDMDALEWKIDVDPANPERKMLFVKYQNFKASIADKQVV
jgi:Rieske Fe-S protein